MTGANCELTNLQPKLLFKCQMIVVTSDLTSYVMAPGHLISLYPFRLDRKTMKIIRLNYILPPVQKMGWHSSPKRLFYFLMEEAAWPSGQRVGLTIRRSAGSSPALATCWICARLSQVQILGHACK